MTLNNTVLIGVGLHRDMPRVISFLRALLLPIAVGVMSTAGAQSATARQAHKLYVTSMGAVSDGVTVNTAAIQAAIDHLACRGGGTVVIPAGEFVSGALFLKPGVNLHLEKGAVLRCSTNPADFPVCRTRIEGRHLEYNVALVNAEGCNGLRITGQGTLDGAGRPVWDRFWELRLAAADRTNFTNLTLARARLAFIRDCTNVVIEGITFKDSQFWNLHLYRCQHVLVRNARFVVPDDYKQAPSTDGIDVDSCQDVAIRGCYFSVTDDCIALKGTKGPLAWEDRESPPVERIRISNCWFRRGHAAVTFGSEATLVRDVIVEKCRVSDVWSVANFKLRRDTPQHYLDAIYRDIQVDYPTGAIVTMRPWRQGIDLNSQPPPQSLVSNITLVNIRGRFGSLGVIEGNPGQTRFCDIKLKNFDLELRSPELKVAEIQDLVIQNVRVNGKRFQLTNQP